MKEYFNDVHDYVDAVDQSIKHWLTARYADRPDALAVSVHQALRNVALLKPKKGGARTLLGSRHAVLREIAAHLKGVLSMSLSAQTSLRTNLCRLDFSEDFPDGLSLDGYPATRDLPEVLRFCLSLSELSTDDQRTALRLYDLSRDKSIWKAQLSFKGWEDKHIELTEELAATNRELSRIWSTRSAGIRNWFESFGGKFFPVDSSAANPIPWIAVDLNDTELIQAADEFESAGNRLRRPFGFVKDASPAQVISWGRDFDTLEDASDALSVIAVWLRVLTGNIESRRCSVCFRHLRSGMKKYCLCHRAQPGKRLPKRTQITADVYKDFWSVDRLFRERSSRLRQVKDKDESFEHLDLALTEIGVKASELPGKLKDSCRGLMACYRPIRNQLNEEFTGLLDQGLAHFIRFCARPFDPRTPEGHEDLELSSRQDAAAKFMTLSSFVSCWFGEKVRPRAFSTFFNVQTSDQATLSGHDPYHPSLLLPDLKECTSHPRALSLRSCGIDLLHHDSWRFCEQHVARAFLPPEVLQEFRERGADSDSPPPSLRKLAIELGLSHEAVRNLVKKVGDGQADEPSLKRASASVLARARAVIQK